MVRKEVRIICSLNDEENWGVNYGVIMASFALMASVTWRRARDAVSDLPSAFILLPTLMFLVRFRLNSLCLVFGGALIGLLVHMAAM
jgi:hypothetical protein